MTNTSQKGVSLYLSFIVMVILLSIALGLASIFFTQTEMIREMGYSVVAFYAADTGIEHELFEKNFLTQPVGFSYSDFLDLDNDGGGITGACPAGLLDSDDACYRVTIISAISPYKIRAVGSYRETQRAIEINL